MDHPCVNRVERCSHASSCGGTHYEYWLGEVMKGGYLRETWTVLALVQPILEKGLTTRPPMLYKRSARFQSNHALEEIF